MNVKIRKICVMGMLIAMLMTNTGFTLAQFSFSQLADYEKFFDTKEFTACSISGEDYGRNKTYEDYTLITDTTSAAYRYIHKHMTVDEKSGFLFDEDGFIGTALGYHFGNIGSRYYVTLDTGIVIPIVKIDAKARPDATDGCQGNTSDDVIEFVIDSDKAMKFFGSSNGYVSNGNFDNYKYLTGKIVKIESVPDRSVTAKYNGWVTVRGKEYFFKDGVIQTGWVTDGTKTYYLDEKSTRKTGLARLQPKDGTGTKWFYFGTDGVMTVSSFAKMNGVTRYFGADGIMKTGLQKINNKWYFFNDNGAMVINGFAKNGNVTRYYGADGVMKTGLQKINNKWYYFSSTGAMTVSNFAKMNGVTRYFGNDGIMKTGLVKINNKWYYFNSSGVMTVSSFAKMNGVTRYFGAEGIMKTGLQKINNKWYYFNDSGVMTVSSFVKMNGITRYFGSDGIMYTGLKKVSGKWYYFSSTGAMYNKGWTTVNGKNRYFGTDGVMAAEQWIDGKYVDDKGLIVEEKQQEAVIGKVEVITEALNVRTGPGRSYDTVKAVYYGDSFNVYEKSSADGYTWYRIGTGQWVADNGELLKYTGS